MLKWRLAAVVLACLLAQAAPAQSGPAARTLEVPANAAWKHAHTELIIPSSVAGSRRVAIRDTGTEEIDVIVNFETADKDLTTTLYLFRSQIPSVSLWFDRSRIVLEQVRQLRVDPAGASPIRSFSLRSGGPESGLRIVYPASGDNMRSTALAVMPLNGWLAKVRMSSSSLDPAALEAKLADWIGAVRWPSEKAAPTAAAALPVQPCPAALSYAKARMLKPDIGQAVFGSLVAVAQSAKVPDASAVYCREPQQSVQYGVYRIEGSSDSYLIALADSGNALSVGTSMDIEKKQPIAGVTMLEMGYSRVLPAFNRLPSPEQVMKALPSMHPLSSVKVGSSTVTMHAPGIKN